MRIITGFIILLLLQGAVILKSQNGLEKIIVERYYVSGYNDTNSRFISGYLPVGSVTYRIFADMLPGYRFQAAYGTASHALKLKTTTTFFNNEDIGNKLPNVIPRRTLQRNTVMLDSWLSAGAAGEDIYGILKEDDDTAGTIKHNGLFLQNKNSSTGISLEERDGLRMGNKVPYPAFFGIDSIVDVFHRSHGSEFTTKNGAWGCLGGAVGVDSLTTNRVLIAQVTTNGTFSFELNLQVGKRNETPQNFVAKDPLGNEVALPSLTFSSADKLETLNGRATSKKNTTLNKK